MTLLTWIVLYSLSGGALSVAAAGTFLLVPNGPRERLMPHMVSFATGALLGAAFSACCQRRSNAPALAAYKASRPRYSPELLLFFVLEKLVIWRHCHDDHCEGHRASAHGDHNGRRSAGLHHHRRWPA
ncbi:MAG: hypothetical protein U1F34_09170 [Gammaproteobacteria bacterium]